MAVDTHVREMWADPQQAHPHKDLRCAKCGNDTFKGDISENNHLGLFCDICGELAWTAEVSHVIYLDKTGYPTLWSRVQAGEDIGRLSS